MADCFEKLPNWARERLKAPSSHKEWKKCSYCHHYPTTEPLKTCAGCAHRPQRVFYCSRKCQKGDWSEHKRECQLINHLREPSSHIYKTERKLERWQAAHSGIVVFCILQIYHSSPAIDPRKHYIQIELDPQTMRMYRFFIKDMSDQAYYFNQPEIQASMTPGAQFYNIIMHDPYPSPFKIQEVTMNRGVLPLLESLETRKQIKRCDAWPWVAAHLTAGGWQPSEDIANNKLNMLLDAIDLNEKNYGKSFKEFCAPVFTGTSAIDMTSAHMNRWYAKLESFDLWAPLLKDDRLIKHFALGIRNSRQYSLPSPASKDRRT